VADDQHPIEIILARGMMANLTTLAFLVDADGRLVFFNDAAAETLGLRFEEAGPMGPEEWGTRFEPLTPEGNPIPAEELPLSVALQHARPAHARLRIRSGAGQDHDIEVSALPIIGQAGQRGAMAVFWEMEPG